MKIISPFGRSVLVKEILNSDRRSFNNGTDGGNDGTNGTDNGNDDSDNGTGDEEEPKTTMQPTVSPAVVEETYITSNAIDLSGQKTVSVRSFTDSAAGTLDNIADGISETY